MKPIIGISGGIMIDQGGRFPGYERVYVNNNYVQSVVRAGGVPFIIPIVNDPELIYRQVEQIDGLIVSGGHDVNPILYGEEPLEKQGAVFPERDEFDQVLIKTTIEASKPVLAICRGIQILNVAFGGTLYQDISYKKGAFIKHEQDAGPSVATHTIQIVRGSLLERILGTESLTNSFHHQAIKDTAPGFKVTAKTKDGIIEAIEKEDADFVIGVQFHPEMMVEKNTDMLNLFKAFINAASKK
ncbi:gamma-glutamyl-gamma-aminobutyrate hydrolase family protein [Geobacillus stearothermophilus]|nr:gamma-glutamyl-gamma-aminobutyrate hydrolase family protein [Geobacillus stearothermophilus]